MCLIPNEAQEKVSNIYTHKYFIFPKKIQNINKMMNGGHLLENNFSTIYIYIWNYFIYIYIYIVSHFYSYILTFSFFIQTNLNSQGNAWNHYYPFCFLGCWITLCLFIWFFFFWFKVEMDIYCVTNLLMLQLRIWLSLQFIKVNVATLEQFPLLYFK